MSSASTLPIFSLLCVLKTGMGHGDDDDVPPTPNNNQSNVMVILKSQHVQTSDWTVEMAFSVSWYWSCAYCLQCKEPKPCHTNMELIADTTRQLSCNCSFVQETKPKTWNSHHLSDECFLCNKLCGKPHNIPHPCMPHAAAHTHLTPAALRHEYSWSTGSSSLWAVT